VDVLFETQENKIMSEVRINVLDAREANQGTIHGSVADALIASLSAEPETIAELEAALDRFCKRHEDHSPFAWFVAGEDTDPWDEGVVIVDLAARIVAAESSYSALQSQGEVNYHNGSEATDVWLPYRLPDDWLFLTSVLGMNPYAATDEPCEWRIHASTCARFSTQTNDRIHVSACWLGARRSTDARDTRPSRT
jgi:hypothetical protein